MKCKNTFSIIMVVLLVAAGVGLRVSCFGNVGPESVYFDLAKVTETQGISPVVHGAVYLYLQLLYLLFRIFGNKLEVAIWMQIVLQLISGGFVYSGVRKLAGNVPALLMLGVLMLSPIGINHALILSPESLFFLVFTITLYACAKCMDNKKCIIGCVAAGLLVAFSCYLDVLGLVLMLFAIIGSLLTSKNFKKVLLYVISGVTGFLLYMLIDSYMSGKQLGNVICAWCNLYIPDMRSVHLLSGELIMLIVLTVIGILGICFVRKAGTVSLWAVTAFGVLILQWFGMVTEEVTGNLEWYILLSILAGACLTALFVKKEVLVETVWEDGRMEVHLEAISVDALEQEPIEETVEVNVMEESSTEDIPAEPQVKFIENPLPLPKKHVKKVLDFDREPEAGQEDFDIEIDENDDFDI